eukprot:gene535-674_t
MEISEIVTPGQRLAKSTDYISSEGTHVHKGYIYSSVLGFPHIIKRSDAEKDNNNSPTSTTSNIDTTKDYIVVVKEKDPGVVPEIGSIVTVKVLRINPKLANCSILCVGTKALKETFNGIIRVQDVRATEIDKVEIYKSFRPGDIVLAQIISLGDSRSYYLSTAKNELGVVFAQSVAGSTMIPISWNMMQCPKTKTKEYRKVAKMDPLDDVDNQNSEQINENDDS